MEGCKNQGKTRLKKTKEINDKKIPRDMGWGLYFFSSILFTGFLITSHKKSKKNTSPAIPTSAPI